LVQLTPPISDRILGHLCILQPFFKEKQSCF
jgi:hypothetical protein